jgi:hypothetical protein
MSAIALSYISFFKVYEEILPEIQSTFIFGRMLN